MTNENALNLESKGTETVLTPNPEIQPSEKKAFVQEWHELIDKKTGKPLIDPETNKPFGLHQKVDPAWENKPIRVEGFETMDPTDIKTAQEQHSVTMAEYKEPETIKEPAKNNPQLVKMLADNKYSINDKDVIIRKGNQIIIKKWNNNDKMFHAIALKTDSLGNPISESKVENFKSFNNYKLTPKEESVPEQKITIERSKTGFIWGKEVKAGQVIQQAPYLKVEGFEKKGDKNTIVLLDKNAGKKMRIPIEVFSVMTKLEDLEKNAVYEQADPEKLLEGVQQIGRGVKAESPAVIQQGIDKLQKYQQKINTTLKLDSKAEEDLVFAKKRIEQAQEKIGELTGTEKINPIQKKKPIEEIQTLPIAAVQTAEVLVPEDLGRQQRTITATEGEYIPFEEIKEDKKQLELPDKEKTPAQLVTDAREAYLALYAESFSKRGAIKRSLFNLGHATGLVKKDAEKYLTPTAKEAKQKYDELKNNLDQNMVKRLTAQGKSSEQIITIMKRYRQVATSVDQLEQESKILKGAQGETFTPTKAEQMTGKILAWYAKQKPEHKKILGITVSAGIGALTGGLSLGFLAAKLARMYVGTKAAALATIIGDKIWKTGVGGKYETQVEELKRKYMSGDITPAQYQKSKEDLEMMDNRMKSAKTGLVMTAGIGVGVGTAGVMNSAVAAIEHTAHIDITPTHTPPVNTTNYDGWNVNLQDYKIDNPSVSEVHTVTTPTEHLQATTVIETAHNDTGPLQIDAEKLNQQIKDSEVHINLDDNPSSQDASVVEDTFGKGNFDATDNQYDNRVISNPELNTTDIEAFANQEYDRMINNNFGSANNALWNDTVKNTDATQFINANPAELKDEYVKLQVDLKTLSTRLNIPPAGNLESYMKVLAHKLAESKQ